MTPAIRALAQAILDDDEAVDDPFGEGPVSRHAVATLGVVHVAHVAPEHRQ